jgi:hypothetical protein
LSKKFLKLHSKNVFPHVISTLDGEMVASVYHCMSNLLDQKNQGKEMICTCAYRLNLFQNEEETISISEKAFQFFSDVEIKF